MFSILIPSYNNLNYLDLCIKSIKKNSKYNHQIIVHINEGSDGSLEYVKKNKINYTYTEQNVGMPKALNMASRLAENKYLVISHDDFYYCPDWDQEFLNELKLIKHNMFYLSGTMVHFSEDVSKHTRDQPPVFNAGKTIEDFNETKLLRNLEKIKTINFQGTTKHPALVYKSIWDEVGGWSEEFSPTGGDDSDFVMKLWKKNIRIFKGLGNCSVYHFGSITTRKKKNSYTYLGSRGNKIFLKKWKIGINFFEKFYLKSGLDKNKKLIFNEFNGPLKEPKKDLSYFYELFINKLNLFYLILINFK